MLEDTEPRRREVASRTCAWGGPWRVGAAWLALLLWALPLGGGCDRPAPRGPQSGAEAEPATGATGVTTGDAPEISRSVGVEGGILVLWPRVVGPRGSPKPTTDLARQLQSRLVAIAQRVAPGRPIDVRPEPERVCPRSGCAAMSLGVLLAVAGKGCVAVALLSDQGQSPAELVVWGGAVQVQANSVPFREPPEDAISIPDYARCETLLQNLDDRSVEAAIQRKLD